MVYMGSRLEIEGPYIPPRPPLLLDEFFHSLKWNDLIACAVQIELGTRGAVF